MLLKISHTTRYTFSEPAHYGLQQLRVKPKSRDSQKILDWKIELTGATPQAEFEDQHHNTVLLASIDEGAEELVIISSGEVETTDTHGVIGQHGGYAPLWYFHRETAFTKPGKGITRLLSGIDKGEKDNLVRMHSLSDHIADSVVYEVGTTDAKTTAEDALAAGTGVCQDHAHILIAAARKLGFPARYVSGYLMMNERVDQEASHAWTEVYLDPVGWVGFDVSNRISPDARYVRVATGLDYFEAAPVSGLRMGSGDAAMADTMLVNIAVQQ